MNSNKRMKNRQSRRTQQSKRTHRTISNRKNSNRKNSRKNHRKIKWKNHQTSKTSLKPSNHLIQYGGVPVQFYAKNPHIRELTSDDFNGNNQIIDVQKRPGIVMFYADWCPHCKSEETQKYWNDTGLRIDSQNGWVGAMNCANDMNKPISQKIGINAFPTILFVDEQGNIINKSM